jgi:hypothetical protein
MLIATPLDVLDLTEPVPLCDRRGRAIRELAKVNHGLVVMQILFETLARQGVSVGDSCTSIIIRYEPNTWN